VQVSPSGATWLVWLIVLLVACPTLIGVAVAILGTGAFAALIPVAANVDEIATQIGVVAPTLAPQATPTPGFAVIDLQFGGEGTGVGRFQDPRAITVDGQENVYVGEYSLGRVQKFDATGEFLISWTPEGENPVMSMGADRQGNVYVVRQGWITKHNAETGEQIAKLTTDGYIEAMGVLPTGNLVAYHRGATDELVFLDPQGLELGRVPQVISGVDDEDHVSFLDMAVDGAGNIYLVSLSHEAVFRYTPEGRFVDRFGGEGDAPGQFVAPQAIAMDSRGRIYVSDFKGIQVFSPDGNYLDVFDIPSGGISGMDFADDDRLYVTANTNEVFRFQINE
jgi:DNA-binding beta-propeller fold protein YncE